MLNTKIKQSGFTIVELLIVIVVIAILAAISIVAYNGIQQRGKASAAEAMASNIAKKSEIYNTEPTTTGYPATFSALTSPTTASYYIDSGSVALTTTALSASTANPEKTVRFMKCGHSNSTTAPTSTATVTNQTGVRVEFWNNGVLDALTVGTTTGFGNPPTNTFPINCQASSS